MNNEVLNTRPLPGEEEVWKVIPSYPAYEASSFGNIRRADTQRLLTPRKERSGYLQVHLRIGIPTKNGKYAAVHRLVTEAFIGDPQGHQVDHVDRDRMNNYYKNLRCVTLQENQKNRSAVSFKISKYVPIVYLTKDGELIARYKNYLEAAADLGIAEYSIRANIHGHYSALGMGKFMREIDYEKIEKNS